MKHASRIIAVMLLLVFGLGTPGYEMSCDDMEMHGQTVMASVEPGAPDDCNQGAGETAMPVCALMCSSIPAVAFEAPVSMGYGSAGFHGALTVVMNGSNAIPDPFPPKHII